MPPLLRRLLSGLLLSMALAGAVVIGFSAPAQAHAVLLESNPPVGSVLTAAPEKISLRFNESVTPVRVGIVVVAPDGELVQQGRASTRAGGRELVADLPAELPQGTFLVSYRVVSADGHPVANGYSFSIGEVSATPELPADFDEQVDPVVLGAYSVGKYATYVGACLVVGAVVVALFLWPRRLPLTVLRRACWAGWWLLVGGTTLWLFTQAPYSYGSQLWSDGGLGFTLTEFGDTLMSTGGIALLVRLGVLFAAIPFLRRTLSSQVLNRTNRAALAALAALAAFTWPLAGHAVASTVPVLAVLTDAAHVAVMAFWAGGLLLLFLALLPKASDEELDAILPVWSRWALLAIALVALTGGGLALVQLGTASAILGSTYGYLVVAKIVSVSLIVLLAAVARRWILRRHQGRALRRVILVELALAAVVLGLATSLTQTAPTSAEDIAALPFTTTVEGDGYRIQIDLDPAVEGPNSLHIYAYDDSGMEVPVEEWKASAELPRKDIAPVSIVLVALSPGHVTGEAFLPIADNWTFHITVRTSEVDQITTEQVIPVRSK